MFDNPDKNTQVELIDGTRLMFIADETRESGVLLYAFEPCYPPVMMNGEICTTMVASEISMEMPFVEIGKRLELTTVDGGTFIFQHPVKSIQVSN